MSSEFKTKLPRRGAFTARLNGGEPEPIVVGFTVPRSCRPGARVGDAALFECFGIEVRCECTRVEDDVLLFEPVTAPTEDAA